MTPKVEYFWHWGLIVLSYINACMGAWIGVKLLSVARHYIENLKFYFVFILLASIGFGLCGVWTMHYTGMLAYQFPHVKVTYNAALVVVSGAAAVILVFIGFFYVGRNVDFKEENYKQSMWKIRIREPSKNDLIHCSLGALIISVGVSTMHYVGMTAVIIDATQEWEIWIIILSILIAVIVSFVGLLLLLFIDGIFGQLVSCLVIGIAVSIVHYTGMHAVTYYENENTVWVSTVDNTDGFIMTAELISIIAASIVSIILILYHIVKFYHYRNTNFYRKRFGNIIIATNVFGLLYSITNSFSIFINDSISDSNNIWRVINVLLLLFAFNGLLGSLLLRYILGWYSINLLSTKESLTWQRILNSSLSDIAKESFFFVNGMRYGNIKWLSKRIYVTFGIILLIDCIFYLNKYVILATIISPVIMLIITLILIIFFYHNTPSHFNDELYMFGEMRLIGLFLLLMSVCTLLGYFIITDYMDFNIYYTFLTMICLTIIAIIPIEILLHKQSKANKNHSKQSKQTLSKCLSNMESFESFIKHLNKEYAMEVLLFIVEQTEWRNHWGGVLHTPTEVNSAGAIDSPQLPGSLSSDGVVSVDMYKRISMKDHYDKEIDFTLPKDMPQSLIVYGYKNDLKKPLVTNEDKIRYCKASAYKLYCKYILPNAEFQVNISYMVRNRLDVMLNDFDEWMKDVNINIDELITIFDPACGELYKLLGDPYSRFLYTQD